MPFWQQNAPQVAEAPRTGIAPTHNSYPHSVNMMGPAELPMAMDNPGSYQPSDGFASLAAKNVMMVRIGFGDHDALQGRLMAVSQADLYDSQGNWMNGNPSGVYDQPNAQIGILPLIRLQPSTSAHPGLAAATGAGPQMIYRTPPSFSAQTTPIYALGL
jgi:hypothetical protein